MSKVSFKVQIHLKTLKYKTLSALPTWAVLGNTGRVGLYFFSLKLCSRPPDTGRAKPHGRPCQPSGFTMGENPTPDTGRAVRHEPCCFQFLLLLFLWILHSSFLYALCLGSFT